MNEKKTVTWPADHVRKLIQCILNLLHINILRDLERRTRSGTGSEFLLHVDSCLPLGVSPHEKNCTNACCAPIKKVEQHGYHYFFYKFKKYPNDHIGQLLDSVVHPYGLKYILSDVAEKAARVHAGVLRKASQDGLTLEKDILKFLRQDILKESTIRCIMERVDSFRLISCSVDAKERGFLASPGNYIAEDLAFLHNETIADLMYKGFAIQHDFIGEEIRKEVLSDVELIEFDGQLRGLKTSCSVQSRSRGDRICWLEQSQIDATQYKGLAALTKRLSALPYELNRKVSSLFCQTSTVFQISVFSSNGTGHQRHLDSGYTKNTDTGRKITVIYCPNDTDWREKDGGFLRIECQNSEPSVKLDDKAHPSQTNENESVSQTIPPKADSLILLKSRTVPYEILPASRNCFFITMWIHGPISLYDNM